MKKVIAKSCSRCMKEIHCNQESIEDCVCAQITISKDCAEYLKATQYDCLCNSCLETLDRLVDQANVTTTKITENIHYVMEGGLMVFTELYHIQRGYCCKSNCRNCAYGYRLS